MTRPKQKRSGGETGTIEQAAQRLNIGINQAYEAARTGQLPAFKIGRRWIVPKDALDRLLSGERFLSGDKQPAATK
jgi:excisionase family DNA binding protein